jgi:hypothetical protein
MLTGCEVFGCSLLLRQAVRLARRYRGRTGKRHAPYRLDRGLTWLAPCEDGESARVGPGGFRNGAERDVFLEIIATSEVLHT